MAKLLLPLTVLIVLLEHATASPSWKTLSGLPPLIVSRGDNSIFPDQTQFAYDMAKQVVEVGGDVNTQNAAYLCDVQITRDNVLICRTRLDLGSNTNIMSITTPPPNASTHVVNGVQVSGYFSVDMTYAQLQNLSAIQANLARPPNSFYAAILTPDAVKSIIGSAPLWLNVEYPTFYSQKEAEPKLDIQKAVASLLLKTPIAYLSSPEVGFLKSMWPQLQLKDEMMPTNLNGNTKQQAINLLLKFRGKDEMEPSTKQTYGSLLSDLSQISGYASGIVVPKDYVWTSALQGEMLESTLIADAHRLGLSVYAYDFVNELFSPLAYSYTFDPLQEYRQFASSSHIVDGFLTDFPYTAATALACYRNDKDAASSGSTNKSPLILSHNGASVDYPGATMMAYDAAIQGGADYIDCNVQITQDNIAICRESIDLLGNTDISLHSKFFPSRLSTFPQLHPLSGLFTFNMTIEEIQTLKATADATKFYSSRISLNPAFNGQQGILTLSQFLNYAKNKNVKILINIQNGDFLETTLGIDVTGAVFHDLYRAGLQNSPSVIIQSEDRSILERLKSLARNTFAYRVVNPKVTINDEVVKEIKALASIVTLPRPLIQPDYKFYLLNNTGIVDLFHNQGMKVFVSSLRNVFVTLPYDYEADANVEIATMINVFKVDGIITENPATATAYKGNDCGGKNSIVTPGDLLSTIMELVPGFYTPPPPYPLLDVKQ